MAGSGRFRVAIPALYLTATALNSCMPSASATPGRLQQRRATPLPSPSVPQPHRYTIDGDVDAALHALEVRIVLAAVAVAAHEFDPGK